MDEDFVLPVTLNGRKQECTARLKTFGYTYKIEVDIEQSQIIFEPDEERNWRAVIPFDSPEMDKKFNPDLLKALAEVIESVTK